MKIRKGFVSNSSSSSFIVAFPTKPKSVEELREMMFGDKQEFHNQWDGDEFWTSQDVAEIVWKDMQEQKPKNIKEIAKELRTGWYFEGILDKHFAKSRNMKFGSDEWHEENNRHEKEMKAASEKKAKEFKDKSKSNIFIFEYSDNDGSLFSNMEHGDIFGKFENIRISKH